ncbi:hypothetical protein BCR43DRAFT_174148 [Syncephalastrum racemosum]|uniref:RRM domain-containing protein n=1 Tax=Syncephalastrum racemosum TaxID=13706 RepID=A0A1X2HPI0_SYNRA|nr:hypothetical protein BCR43DRAFT_174148 [Syncephalastrum racemosum]
MGSLPAPPLSNSLYNVLMTNTNDQATTFGGEEISTIFVVGFPDDMQEREFQNMFTFSPGFEAATLKVPSKDQDEDLPQVSGNNNNNNNARKQIIGFAKFRTRLEALEAKDVLSGRKVDAEKGSVLKAEMAKKNLHTKRGLSSDQKANNPNKHRQQSAYEAFYSVPPDLLPPLNQQDFSYDLYHPPDLFSPMSPPSQSGFPDPMFLGRTDRASSMGDIYSSSTRYGFNHRSFDDTNHHYFSSGAPTAVGGGGGGQLASVVEEQQHPHFNHQSQPQLPLPPPFRQQPSPPLPQPSLSSSSQLDARLAGLTINTLPPSSVSTGNNNGGNNGAGIGGGLPSPPGMASPTQGPCYRSLFGAIGSMDQNNPPCNTLYVGNLPLNTDEDELKAMFESCPGYKRLSFRSKANGPMCFVEFEDVACASQALQELHGNMLSNSVKGGIRLSFSKNPLGVRQNATMGYALPFEI